MDFDYTPKQRKIYETVGELGRTRFAARAADYDARAVTPVENLKDLVDAGYAAAALSEEIGGLGGGALGKDPLASLLVVEQTARYCLSTAQCIHIHYNASHRIEQIGSPAQRKRLLGPVVEEGKFVNSTGSEPGRTARGLYNLQTVAEKVPGGWRVNGVKNYATLADTVHYNTIAAVAKDTPPPGGHLMLALPQGVEGLTIEPGSWDPIGMRAAVSPVLTLKDVFVPERDQLGELGESAKGRWQAKSHLSFAAQYIGGAEGVFDLLTEYLPRRGTAGDGYTQLRLGEIRIAIDAARWLTYRAAWLWARDIAAAELFSMNAKHQAIAAAVLAVERGAQIAGSSALDAGSALSRFIRDLRYQTLHENYDKTAATIGKYHLGQAYDVTSRL
ncbi:acyl-CoA dehydrogenase family protein [Verticiella sediminum]|uniref:Acyl-CoA dehydrogenase family protein n=1 Tax=Verticiella sediminum TaxID=1247510 RepID=A0A556ACW3_9BURK|nr:acyl-CoA dehydrogenase family protein [Verticiella sediminum]TSH90719.1 acyl-CoA dehydrogenase family protein [Verticiella sediminum]